MAVSNDLWVAYTRIFFVEIAYWVVSIGMVFVNEFVLSTNLLSDDLTVFVTIFQILFSLCILISLNHISKTYFNPQNNYQTMSHIYDIKKFTTSPSSITVNTKLIENDQLDEVELDNNNNNDELSNHSNLSNTFKRPNDRSTQSDGLITLLTVNIPGRINLNTCKLVFPLSILYIGMLLLNNFCLKYVGVAFYFVSRSLTTVFNVAFTYFLINEPVSRGALICCALIVLGFILGIDQESVIGSLSVIGVIFGIASSLFTSLFSIYTKKTLAKLDKNIWVLVLYNNINAIILCTPLLIIHGDVQALISDKVISPTFWALLSASGIMAFFISIVTNASIKYTSPLTHNISGTAKACLQTVIAVIYYHDHKSNLWWLSNITILVASAAYSRIKQLEMEERLQISIKPNSAKLVDNASFDSVSAAKRIHRSDSESSASSYEVHFDSDCCSIKLESGSD